MENNILLARHGLMKEDFFTSQESIAAQILLHLKTAAYALKEEWNDLALITAIREVGRKINSPGRQVLIDPVSGDLPLTVFDPYIRGVVRWLNELGIYTLCSCGGHGSFNLLSKRGNSEGGFQPEKE